MIRRLYARWRHRNVLARTHGPVIYGRRLRDRTAGETRALRRLPRVHRRPHQIADMERRWNGGQR